MDWSHTHTHTTFSSPSLSLVRGLVPCLRALHHGIMVDVVPDMIGTRGDAGGPPPPRSYACAPGPGPVWEKAARAGRWSEGPAAGRTRSQRLQQGPWPSLGPPKQKFKSRSSSARPSTTTANLTRHDPGTRLSFHPT